MKGVGTVVYGSSRDKLPVIEDMMAQYGTGLLRMSALYLKDADLAQDAVQETFVKACRNLGSYRGESSEKTWLTTICMNVCRDMRRTAWFRHRSPIDPDTLPEQPVPFEFPDNTVLTEVMHLPDKYRQVILLRYYQDLTLGEVASALQLSTGKVRYRLDRANAILRDRLKEGQIYIILASPAANKDKGVTPYEIFVSASMPCLRICISAAVFHGLRRR